MSDYNFCSLCGRSIYVGTCDEFKYNIIVKNVRVLLEQYLEEKSMDAFYFSKS